jgi:hypothetical protein
MMTVTNRESKMLDFTKASKSVIPNPWKENIQSVGIQFPLVVKVRSARFGRKLSVQWVSRMKQYVPPYVRTGKFSHLISPSVLAVFDHHGRLMELVIPNIKFGQHPVSSVCKLNRNGIHRGVKVLNGTSIAEEESMAAGMDCQISKRKLIIARSGVQERILWISRYQTSNVVAVWDPACRRTGRAFVPHARVA